MITVSVLYPNEAGSRFDMGYYLGSHIPMVQRLLDAGSLAHRRRGALKSVVVEQGLGGPAPGSQAPYSTVCHLRFASLDEFPT